LDDLRALKMDCRLEVLIDYCRIHFKTKDVKKVVEELMKFPFELMQEAKHGFYGFSKMYEFGDIAVMHEPRESDSLGKSKDEKEDEKKGEDREKKEDLYTMLELKGKGCRLFEAHLESIGWTWYDFFDHCFNSSLAEFKRLDLAIDDYDGLLNVSELIRKSKEGEFESRWINSFSSYDSGKRLSRREPEDHTKMGRTLYIGSFKSDILFCVYEKDYEQYKKEGIPIEEAPVKNRFEIRLKNERAIKAAEDLVSRRDVDTTIYEIINRYIAFIDWVDEEQVLNPRWAKFMGNGRGELKLTMKPEPYTIERTLKWFKKQVAPSLLMLETVDGINGTNRICEIMENTSMSSRQVQVLKQLAMFKE